MAAVALAGEEPDETDGGTVSFGRERLVETRVSPDGSTMAWLTVTPIKEPESKVEWLPRELLSWKGASIRIWVGHAGESRVHLVHERTCPELEKAWVGYGESMGPKAFRWSRDSSMIAYVAERKLIVVPVSKVR